MDVLADLLNLLRINRVSLIRSHFRDPWSVAFGQSEGSVFHGVIKGRCWVNVAGSAGPIELFQGDIIVLSAGSPHVICSQLEVSPLSPRAVGIKEHQTFQEVHHGDGGEETVILGGSFSFAHPAAVSLLPLLPPTLHLSSRGDESVLSMLNLISEELGHMNLGFESIVIRTMQNMFVFLLRHHAATDMVCNGSFMLAIKDRRISSALTLIHNRPEDKWTVDLLASKVGMSRSGFFSRFKNLMGDSPANYLGRWRMFTAADIMNRFPMLSTVEVAERVGYRSESAFAKAFKSHMGVTPSGYRVALEH